MILVAHPHLNSCWGLISFSTPASGSCIIQPLHHQSTKYQQPNPQPLNHLSFLGPFWTVWCCLVLFRTAWDCLWSFGLVCVWTVIAIVNFLLSILHWPLSIFHRLLAQHPLELSRVQFIYSYSLIQVACNRKEAWGGDSLGPVWSCPGL